MADALNIGKNHAVMNRGWAAPMAEGSQLQVRILS